MAQQQIPAVIHLAQLGSTTTIDTPKAREDELYLLVDTINKESRIRREKRKEQIEKIKTKHDEFLTKCENKAKQFISILEGVETDKPLDKAYQIFVSVVSKFQAQLQERKE